MTPYYTHYFADAGHSGALQAPAAEVLKPAWTATMEPYAGRSSRARLLLTAENRVIVDAGPILCAYDPGGALLWRRPKWPGGPVVCKNGLLCFASEARPDRMMAVDLDNRVMIETVVFPEHGEGSYATFFEPTAEGLVAQIQYAAVPEMRAPNFIVYCADADSYGYRWARRYLGQYSPLVPVVNAAARQIVTADREAILCFDLLPAEEEPEPRHRFPIPFQGQVRWMSCGDDGRIYFAGFDKGRALLAVSQPDGFLELQWRSATDGGQRREPVAPPLLMTGRIGLLCRGSLCMVAQGQLLWEKTAQKNPFLYATALADGGLLAVEGPNALLRIDAAGRTLDTAITEDSITTPPVCLADGHVMLGAGETLYAFAPS
jgi:hypothetical protein